MSGVYLLEVLSPHMLFSQVKVKLPASSAERVLCLEMHYSGAKKQPRPYPIQLTAHTRASFFQVQLLYVRVLS